MTTASGYGGYVIIGNGGRRTVQQLHAAMKEHHFLLVPTAPYASWSLAAWMRFTSA